MAARDTPSKSARSTIANVDLEPGLDHDQITPSGSSSLTPDHGPSKPSTPTLRDSLQLDDGITHARPNTTSSLWRFRRKMERTIPRPVVDIPKKIMNWVRGPEPPRIYKITPFFERWQTLPVRTFARLPRWLRICIFGIACILWITIFGVVVSGYSLPSNIGGFGAPVRLACVANLWYVSH